MRANPNDVIDTSYVRNDVNPPKARYEGLPERIARVLSDNDALISSIIGPLQDRVIYVIHYNSVSHYLREVTLGDEVEVYGSRKLKEERRKFVESFPDANFRPLLRIWDAILASSSQSSDPSAMEQAQEVRFAQSSVCSPLICNVPFIVVKGEESKTFFKHPFMFFQAETVLGNSDRYETDFIVAHREDAANAEDVTTNCVTRFIHRLNNIDREIAHQGRCINVYGQDKGIEIKEQSWMTWDEVFLEEEHRKAIQDDLVFFLKNEQLFRDVGLPYKRGYLLCGPPGNGKTSVCRTIATSMPFSSYMFDFSDSQMGNSDLSDAFRWAANNAPSVFFLEDIDRIYDAESKNQRANVTLDHLLNCLDGIAVNDGLVVVATANNPKSLDPAILSRPGRFDKVVVLDNPGHSLREKYLRYLFRKQAVDDKSFRYMVDESEGLSMAFLKEIFLVSMSRSVLQAQTLTHNHIVDAMEEITKQWGGISRSNNRKAGFGS